MARPSAIELANELSQSKQSPEHHAEMNPKQSPEHHAEMNPKQVNEALKPPHDIGFEYGMGLEL